MSRKLSLEEKINQLPPSELKSRLSRLSTSVELLVSTVRVDLPSTLKEGLLDIKTIEQLLPAIKNDIQKRIETTEENWK